MMIAMTERLLSFQERNEVHTKGSLAVVIQITRMAGEKEFPLDEGDFLTKNKGQVLGLGGANLKKILKEHGIERVLATEAGRTSRGSINLMKEYVSFLNAWSAEESINFRNVEEYWAIQIRNFFNNQPFTLDTDPSQTIASSLNDLFRQARERQKENPGTQYLGTVLQHLVAAKLLTILPQGSFEIHGASVADSPTDRNGDFVIGKTVLHCTSAPGQALIQKCQDNIKAGCFPVVITVYERVQTAFDLCADMGLEGRVEVWDIQQFLSTNINEHGLFNEEGRSSKFADIISCYNTIIDEKETDPSLKITFAGIISHQVDVQSAG